MMQAWDVRLEDMLKASEATAAYTDFLKETAESQVYVLSP